MLAKLMRIAKQTFRILIIFISVLTAKFNHFYFYRTFYINIKSALVSAGSYTSCP